MIHYNSCPLCNSETTGLHIQTNDFFLTGEPYSLFRCHMCGFIFTQDHPDESEAGRYYCSEDYLSHNDSARGLVSFVYRYARELMLGSKRRLITRHTGMHSGNILDFGSGSGHFLAEMKSHDWETTGVEINEKARLYSNHTLGVKAISPQDVSALPENSFDCVTLWHVLEHLQDFHGTVSKIFRLLKPGGLCIAALPNCSSCDALFYRKFWAAFDTPRHLWHFTPSSFSLFADKMGFRIVALKRLPLDVFYISALSEKYKGNSFSFILGTLRGTWFSFLSAFNKSKSSSLVYILRKK